MQGEKGENLFPSSCVTQGHENMSQRGVERTLGRLVTDPAFREKFFRTPMEAGLHIGVELTRQETEALLQVPLDALIAFSGCLDDRICRLYVRHELIEQESRQ